MTPLEQHFATWRNGCGCELCPAAKKVVIGKGENPCDVCFVGEAPGDSEDVLGDPFVGPAGEVLDHIVSRSLARLAACATCRRGNVLALMSRPAGSPVGTLMCQNGHDARDAVTIRLAYTNVLGCIPKVDGTKARTIEPVWAKTCSPRLVEFLQIVRPRAVVAVGDEAMKYLDPKRKTRFKDLPDVPVVHIKHPSAILRETVAARSHQINRCVITLNDMADAWR